MNPYEPLLYDSFAPKFSDYIENRWYMQNMQNTWLY